MALKPHVQQYTRQLFAALDEVKNKSVAAKMERMDRFVNDLLLAAEANSPIVGGAAPAAPAPAPAPAPTPASGPRFVIAAEGDGNEQTKPTGANGMFAVALFDAGKLVDSGVKRGIVQGNLTPKLLSLICAELHQINRLSPKAGEMISIRVGVVYIRNGINLWLDKWRGADWRVASGERDISNKKHWMELDGVLRELRAKQVVIRADEVDSRSLSILSSKADK